MYPQQKSELIDNFNPRWKHRKHYEYSLRHNNITLDLAIACFIVSLTNIN